MKITIAERFKPFSHRPGTICPVPFTGYAVQVFPSMVRAFNLATGEMISEGKLEHPTPLKDFTVQLDLEKNCVKVWGKSNGKTHKYNFDPKGAVIPSKREKLSLGMNKALDWDDVVRRRDLKEILPIWFYLGQSIPLERYEGGDSLLERCCLLDDDLFLDLFLAGFSGILAPRTVDTDYQGYAVPPVAEGQSPLAILRVGAEFIRSLFIQQDNEVIHILPALPKSFQSGRMINLDCGMVEIDMEWRKNEPNRLCIRAKKEGSIQLVFPKSVKTMRLSKKGDQKGARLSCGSSIDIQPGKEYFLDQFMH